MILSVSGRNIPPLMPLYALRTVAEIPIREISCASRGRFFSGSPVYAARSWYWILSSWLAAMHSCCESARSLLSVAKITSRTMKAARPATARDAAAMMKA